MGDGCRGAALVAALDDAEDYDTAGFAIGNLGFVRFQSFGDSLVEIELGPARAFSDRVEQQFPGSPVSLRAKRSNLRLEGAHPPRDCFVARCAPRNDFLFLLFELMSST